VIATLTALAKAGEVKHSVIQAAIDKYQINDINAADPGNTEGSG
jgi:pyruvate dehydrogenase E1 component